MIVRHFSECLQNQIQSLVDKTITTEPEKVPATGFEVFPFGPRINERRRDRDTIDRFVCIFISTDSEPISQDSGAVSVLDRLGRPVEFDHGQSDSFSLLECEHPGAISSVMK